MAKQFNNSLGLIVMKVWLLVYLAVSLLLETNSKSYIFASASLGDEHNPKNDTVSSLNENNIYNDDLAQKCIDCQTLSNSIEGLLAQPRQMDAYGQVEDRIDLEKIKKAVCKDIICDKKRERCRNFYYTQQSAIEKWKQSRSRISFFDFVCIKELKYCCPRNSYGPRCTKCKSCDLNETCSGEGTRTGNGTCVCKEGHSGQNCSYCSPGYYDEKPKYTPNDKNSTIKTYCKPCHRSCLFCRREGSLGCEVCRSGFTWVPIYGCSDVDECIQSNNKICRDNTFCVNTEGSYFCYECDRACNGCYGDGPDMCLKCANGYKLDNGNCLALKKTILPPEANYYRYGIYTGLLICTSVILANNIYIAALVGLGVSFYIGVSEYIMSTHLQEVEQQMQTV